MHGQQNIKPVKQVEEAVKKSAVVSNHGECEKYRVYVDRFLVLYGPHYMVNNITAEL